MEFRYTARDISGKEIEGVLEAPTPSEAARILRERGLYPITIKPEKKIKFSLSDIPFFRKVSLKEIAIFTRQLAAMVGAGISLPAAIDTIAQQVENRRFVEILINIKEQVETGVKFSEALRKYQKIFGDLYVSMVEAGETTGELDVMLNRWFVFAEKVLALRRKVRSAMMYPTMIVIFAIVLINIILIKVVPTFVSIFRESGMQLPALTQMVITISDTLRKHFLEIWAVVAASIMAFRFALSHSMTFRKRWDAFKLRMPIFGNLIRKAVVARFARTMATMLRSGVNILDGLEIVARTSGNKVVEDALVEARLEVEKGELLSATLKKAKVFPPMVIEMVAAGERTGSIDEMLDKVADFFEDEVDSTVSALTSIVEPILLVFIGLIIGVIVLALYLPIFKMASAVR